MATKQKMNQGVGMSDLGKEIFIQSILPVEQCDDSLLFEMIFTDSDGNKYKSRFHIRNHNVGLFNLALNKIRPTRMSNGVACVSHTSPRGPVLSSRDRASNNSGGQSCP